MTEEEFAILSLENKWMHLKATMSYIVQVDSMYGTNGLRARYNSHHNVEQKKEEQRNLRLDQYQRWQHLKNLYAAHRDEMVNTLDIVEYEKCKGILERIFTMELDDALRNVLDE